MTFKAHTQISSAFAEYEDNKKITRRKVFLGKMGQVAPCARLVKVIEPHYPKSGKRGRPPAGIERMLRWACPMPALRWGFATCYKRMT
jgi:transposase, IS5 family